jgi:DNA-binding transcriptional MerR regulator
VVAKIILPRIDVTSFAVTVSAATLTRMSEGLLTIEQLATATGMSVRNLRSHRTAGLLPPPHVRDRIGYYGPEHSERVRLVQELQGMGFNLRGIKRLLDQTRGDPSQLLSLKRVISTPFETEAPQVFTVAELAERLGPDIPPGALEKAVQVGVLIPVSDGQYEAPAPSLIDMAAEVVSRGVPLEHALTVFVKVRERCEQIGREFVRLFLEDLWKPFADAGYPDERWHEVEESIERLRPLSSQAVLAVYQLTMSSEVERAFGRELERLSRRRR